MADCAGNAIRYRVEGEYAPSLGRRPDALDFSDLKKAQIHARKISKLFEAACIVFLNNGKAVGHRFYFNGREDIGAREGAAG